MKSKFCRATNSLITLGALSAGLASVPVAQAQPDAVPVMATIETPVEQPVKPNSHLSLSGAVGLTLNPTAQLPAPGEVRVQLDYFDLGTNDNDSTPLDLGLFELTPDDETIGEFSFFSLHAATRFRRSRLEINGGIEKLRAMGGQAVSGSGSFGLFGITVNSEVDYDEMDRYHPAIGAKYLLLGNDENVDSTRVAVGAGYNPALFKNAHAYVVASKPFQIGGRRVHANLGGRYDRFKFESRLLTTISFDIFGFPIGSADLADENFREESSKFSAFAGVEVPITRNGQFAFIGEIATKNSDFNDDERVNIAADLGLPTSKFPYSAAIRYYDRNGLNATVGIMRQGVLDDSGVFAQVGYGF